MIWAQQYIVTSDGSVVNDALSAKPVRNVSIVPDGVIVSYDFRAFQKRTDHVYEGTNFITADGFGLTDIPGNPAIPMRWDSFVVPENAIAKVSVVDSVFIDIPMELSPARPELVNSGNQGYSKTNVSAITPYHGYYPSQLLHATKFWEYRGTQVFDVCISPVQYDYQKKIIRLYRSITYKVSFYESNSAKNTVKDTMYIGPDDKFLENVTLNATHYKNPIKAAASTQQISRGYLIVSTTKYDAAVNMLARWKKKLGFNVHILIQDSWSSYNQVREAVLNEYSNDNTISNLLIIGGQSDVPAKSESMTLYVDGVNQTFTYLTDLFFGCLGSQNVPSVRRGRIPVTTLSEALIVVNKIIDYERYPTTNETFYQTGLNCAYFQDDDIYDEVEDRNYVRTSEEIRDAVLSCTNKNVNRVYYYHYTNLWPQWYSDWTLLPAELRDYSFDWDGNSANIISNINNGCFYVFHRDHGLVYEWYYPELTTQQIGTLNNGKKLPVVFSINCETGRFEYSDCFAETFLKKSNGGCVGIFAATDTTLNERNDVLAKGMFDAIWPCDDLFPMQSGTPVYSLGQILDQGMAKMDLATYTGGTYEYCMYNRRIYHCFGDPSMQIYTQKPTAFNNASVIRSGNAVTAYTGGEDAVVSFYNKVTGEVISFLTSSSAGITTEFADYVDVCISAHNKIPYVEEGEIMSYTKYIQNETVNGPKAYYANIIEAGSSVTNSKPTGPVVFSGGNIILKGSEITLEGETTITTGTVFELRKQ